MYPARMLMMVMERLSRLHHTETGETRPFDAAGDKA